jgi:hypothetical protein
MSRRPSRGNRHEALTAEQAKGTVHGQLERPDVAPNVGFMLGDHVISYGSDAAVMSVKWRTMKVVFRYSESTSGPIIKPRWPFIFDLINDPVEEWDLIETRLDCAWVMAPVAQRLGALHQSVARYPNIAPRSGFHRIFMNHGGEDAG